MKNQAVIRLVTWNIEKGKRWALLEKCLESDVIRNADILCLNEVDDGMARSGNRRIAQEIGAQLEMHVVFAPAFREFTKGAGDELLAPGENTTAVQGNATLSRLPVLDTNNLQLPTCHDPSQGPERREGSRCALISRLDYRGRLLTVVNTHLEVFTTMRCRSRQMRAIIQNVGSGPAIITGDFNTNTFERGSFLSTFKSLAALLRSDVKHRVLNPWLREPLFHDLEHAGFHWKGCVDDIPTCSVDISTLEDKKFVPAFIRNRLLHRVRTLPLKLDFIAVRGLRAASSGRTVTELPFRPSDHLPVTCELILEN
jgi:endonuclease/exonuclease/phosphatase family metal-dependent hydrolase